MNLTLLKIYLDSMEANIQSARLNIDNLQKANGNQKSNLNGLVVSIKALIQDANQIDDNFPRI